MLSPILSQRLCYAIAHCGTLVEAPYPIAAIKEQLDIDDGFGPLRKALCIQPNHGFGEVFYPDRHPSNDYQKEIIFIKDDPVPKKVFKQRGGIVIKENSEARNGVRPPPVIGKGKAKMFVGESSKS
ncbi:hypothetical protein DCAR_0102151 [Daucus carota subsp. sativus]|uniref:Uncharacterized protein n=1 Tax=Daucus carota subsp. sativus TaxID=79200 RepID=A0A166GX25_DAUCS|nr:hypothetical protein DCAR_0102151 [Daucus carota subsp. sativus]